MTDQSHLKSHRDKAEIVPKLKKPGKINKNNDLKEKSIVIEGKLLVQFKSSAPFGRSALGILHQNKHQ